MKIHDVLKKAKIGQVFECSSNHVSGWQGCRISVSKSPAGKEKYSIVWDLPPQSDNPLHQAGRSVNLISATIEADWRQIK